MFERTIITTEDGSQSIYVEGMNEHYHSTHGALQESLHIFINNGLKLCTKKSVSILEIGLGTGLNVLVTLKDAMSSGLHIHFHSLEKYPLVADEYSKLHFDSLLGEETDDYLKTIHTSEWDCDVKVLPDFILHKTLIDLLDWQPSHCYDVVYFDAFAPDKQPDLWTEKVFRKIYLAMNDGGVLSTYCAKGQVKRNLKAAGFIIESKPGPPGKREITVARK